jgi:carbamoyl-phosphate synthase large subunit
MRPHLAVVNTVTGNRRHLRNGFLIRRAATERRVPYFTSLDTLRAALAALDPRVTHQRVLTVDEYRQALSDERPGSAPLPLIRSATAAS